MMLLRSMQQARYSEHNHMGIMWTSCGLLHSHFTNQICRYPDPLVHRMIRTMDVLKEVAEHFEQVSSRDCN